jgi:hypothetical protein
MVSFSSDGLALGFIAFSARGGSVAGRCVGAGEYMAAINLAAKD